jgi:CRISPR-associated protein Cas1
VTEQIRPRQILLSKRANVFYLEHVRVMQKDGRIVYLTDSGEDFERYFNIPERNTALVLLGKGTSITDAAVRRMAESNVLVGFCGSGGTPLHAVMEPVFLTPQSEYRPTEYMQKWVASWVDETRRLVLAKALTSERVNLTERVWSLNPELLKRKITVLADTVSRFRSRIAATTSTQDLLLAEAVWAKALYQVLAQGYGFEFQRREGERGSASKAERVNSLLDHGNYLAYGLAAVALNGLGISFSFPLLHGKTRRGALVFDIADLIKDAYVMPLAFEMGTDSSVKDREFRGRLIEVLQEEEVLDLMFGFVKELCENTT